MPHDKWCCRLVYSLAVFCIAGPAIGAGASFDGEYTGKRVLTKGPADACVAEENVSVIIENAALALAYRGWPAAGGYIAYATGFDPRPDGTFDIGHDDLPGSVVKIHGRVAGGVLNADVNDPPCEHHWEVKKK